MEKSGSLADCDFSVSEVVTAFKCPLQFYFSRKGIVAHFYYGGKSVGSFVHKVLSEFANLLVTHTLFESENELNLVENTLYRSFYNVAIKSKSYRTNLEDAWQYIKSIGAYFEGITVGKSTSEIRDMFILSERSFSVNFFGTQICGRFDLLLRDERKIRIVDYKTRDRDPEVDAVQIALYKYAVKQITGVDAEPVLLYILDGELKEEVFTEEEYSLVISGIRKQIKDMKDFLSGRKVPERTVDRTLCNHCSLKTSCKVLRKKFFGL